ncbi:hypothetical protein SEA_SEPHIROTH_63 [Gordonia Phage Sephiroth]|uniref:Uncharacterized protein n=1 Tax=Gordonia Phage Sephiroth TaxID=2767553 RepID=A0A7G9UZF0_9CAUD|nr:hypothetical protein L3Y23_gp063 [Gordonia Phage Sephiroth]QNN99405.1 hypothetical protein SEA_SEPHIROTH_63 [Gordonia Phage Sephiroth]
MSYQDDLLLWAVSKAEASGQWTEGAEAIIAETEQERRYGGYCDTCSYEYEVTTVRINYRIGKGRVRSLTVELGEMSTSDVIQDVLEFCDELRAAGK